MMDDAASAFANGAPVDDAAAAFASGKPLVDTKEAARGVIASFLAGTGAGFGKSMLGLQQLAGKGIGLLPDRAGGAVGQWLADDAKQGIQRLNDQNRPYADANPTTNLAGDVVGQVANPINYVLPAATAAKAPGFVAALPGLFAQGAVQGAVAGAATPVDNPDENYGWTKTGQILAGGLAGGVMAPAVNGLLQAGGNLVARGVGAVRGATPADVEAAIAKAAAEHGVDLTEIPPAMMAQVRRDVAAAMARGQVLDPAAAIRKVEGDAVLGKAGLTTGQSTRDPRMISTEQNSKGLLGGEQIQNRFNEQGGALIDQINALGAREAGTPYQTGDALGNALRDVDKGRKANVSSLYDNANALNGGEIPLDSASFANAADAALNPKGGVSSTAFLPDQFKSLLNDISSGKLPLTVSVAEQLKTMLATAQRATADGNVKQALGAMQGAFDQAQPAVKLGEEATNAFNLARSAHKARMTAIDENPALAAAVDNVAPDQFFQKFVLKGNARDLQGMVDHLVGRAPETAAPTNALTGKVNPLQLEGPAGATAAATEATVPPVIMDVRRQIVNYLKSKAVSGIEEDNNFSQSGYNTALKNIGPERLAAFFSPAEIADLNRLGRVASYTQSYPRGSTVNSSNSASAIAYNALGAIGQQVPVLGWLYKGVKAGSDTATVRSTLAGKIPTQAEEGSVNALRLLMSPVGAAAGASTANQVP
jgi:hypothetical protein